MDASAAGSLMEPSIWRFFLFVVTVLIWMICCFAVSMLLGFLILRARQIKAAYVISSFALLELVTYVFLILFILILTGSSHIELFAVLMAVSAFGYLSAEFMWLLVCPDTTSFMSYLMWAKGEMAARFPLSSKVLEKLGMLPLLVYPVWIGIGYFGSALGSGNWEKYVLKVTLLGFIGLAYVLQLPNSLYVMTARNTAGAARVRIVLNQFAQTPSVLLLISVFMWTIAATGNTRALFGGYFVYSPTITYFVVGYVGLFLLLPFIVGHFRTKAWVDTLVARRGEFSRRLADQLRRVKVASALADIAELRTELDTNIAQLHADAGVQLANTIYGDQSPQALLLSFVLPDIQKYDPRFIHLRELIDLRKCIDEVEEAVNAASTDKYKRELLCAAADAVEKHAAASQEAKSPGSVIIILLSAIFSGVASPVVASIGKWLVLRLGLPGGE